MKQQIKVVGRMQDSLTCEKRADLRDKELDKV